MFSILKTTIITTLLLFGNGEESNHSSCDLINTLAKSTSSTKAYKTRKSCFDEINNNIKIVKKVTTTYNLLHTTISEPKRDYCKELATLHQHESNNTFMHEFILVSTACKQQINIDKQKYNNAVRNHQNTTRAQLKKIQANTTKK